MKKLKWDDNAVQCIVCDKELEIDNAKDIIHGMGPWQGIQCEATGNYGSQVFDMEGPIYFVICDGCMIRKSNKMLKADYHDCHKCRDEAFSKGEGIQCARDYFEKWWDSVKTPLDLDGWPEDLVEHQREGHDEYKNTIEPYFND